MNEEYRETEDAGRLCAMVGCREPATRRVVVGPDESVPVCQKHHDSWEEDT